MNAPAPHPLRVLLIDDCNDEVDAILAALSDPDGRNTHVVEVVHELEAGVVRIQRGGVDVILLELDLPDVEGLEAFDRVYSAAPDVPVIALGRSGDEDTALLALRRGAQDFLEREELGTAALRRSIRYALERHRLMAALRSLSMIDELTALYNRRGFQDLGEQYLKLSRRSGRGASLAYVDLDGFKVINDTYGHTVGDEALVQAADVLRGAFRASDLVARVGGDEFAVLAPNSSDDPGMMARRVRDAFAHYNEATLDPYELVVSVGTARTDGG
ncbi:MAG TPA: diguanylate cyclase, partial [Longimicrobiales bacterium]|nr:diguanylate cyclase [Longimicrobiales bacterium]